ncbi:MAG TPA: hypothetical protein VG273_10880 [Bryobacteraceae bacterium]|jgi:hypothetical protein|nr:hypothetical protein [Bryobacteraceae bacterium]
MPLVKRIAVSAGAAISMVVIIAITLPRVAHAPRYRQEMWAVRAISTIHMAEMQYLEEYGRYASSLTQLGPGSGNANLIDSELARGEGGGFKLVLNPTPVGYSVVVTPSRFRLAGSRTWFSDENMTIHQHSGQEPATVNDPLLGEAAAPHTQTPAK